MNRSLSVSAVRYLFVLVLSSGCASSSAPRPDTDSLPSEELRLHRVESAGETLPMIARWYTGNSKNWYKLRGYNGHLRSTSGLAPGTVIRIPAGLMIRTDRMSSTFIEEERAKAKRSRKKRVSQTNPNQNTAVGAAEPPVEPEAMMPEPPGPSADSAGAGQDQLIENLLSE